MYKLPETFNLNTLEGETIHQLSYGLNFITLSFEKGYIQFSGSFSFGLSNEMVIHDEVFPVTGDYGLLVLLEKKISLVSTNNNRTQLNIVFENNYILTLIGSEMYESYTLNVNGDEILV